MSRMNGTDPKFSNYKMKTPTEPLSSKPAGGKQGGKKKSKKKGGSSSKKGSTPSRKKKKPRKVIEEETEFEFGTPTGLDKKLDFHINIKGIADAEPEQTFDALGPGFELPDGSDRIADAEKFLEQTFIAPMRRGVSRAENFGHTKMKIVEDLVDRGEGESQTFNRRIAIGMVVNVVAFTIAILLLAA